MTEGGEDLFEEAAAAWQMLRDILRQERWDPLRREWKELEELLSRYALHLEGGSVSGVREEEAAFFQIAEHRYFLDVLRRLTPEQRADLLQFYPAAVEEAVHADPPRVSHTDVRIEWVSVPDGEFLMGAEDGLVNERPVRRVRLRGFRIARTPVTNAEYSAFLRETGGEPPLEWEGGEFPAGMDDHPAVHLDWDHAAAWCAWYAHRCGFEVGLPTEAQWERAARGTDGRKYPWGNDPPTRRLANFGGHEGGTTPVGRYSEGASPLGLLDLCGNVWEWCRDWYAPYPEGAATDPMGPEEGNARVVRGGAWRNSASSLRAAARNFYPPDFESGLIGFRPAAPVRG